ncbi:MAG: DNA-formamidopyrimidine glycosylase family protein [Candidatus Thorarchaeota archaeon]
MELKSLSIELPEVDILARQMNSELVSKHIEKTTIDNYEKLQKQTFFNKDISLYDRLNGCKIESVVGRGTVIRLKMNKNMNLLLAPEMGGELRYHPDRKDLPKKFHLLLDYKDGSAFSVRLKGYGLVLAASDGDLANVYSYNRDFLNGVSPLEVDYTLEYLTKILEERDKNLKTLLVGKEAVVVGFGNAGFQEIAYKAGIHPKRKSSTFTKAENKALYTAIMNVTESRIKKGGKDSFTDIYGKQGEHCPLIGGHLRDKPCPKCGTTIERLMFGGGPTYLCPSCQK